MGHEFVQGFLAQLEKWLWWSPSLQWKAVREVSSFLHMEWWGQCFEWKYYVFHMDVWAIQVQGDIVGIEVFIHIASSISLLQSWRNYVTFECLLEYFVNSLNTLSDVGTQLFFNEQSSVPCLILRLLVCEFATLVLDWCQLLSKCVCSHLSRKLILLIASLAVVIGSSSRKRFISRGTTMQIQFAGFALQVKQVKTRAIITPTSKLTAFGGPLVTLKPHGTSHQSWWHSLASTFQWSKSICFMCFTLGLAVICWGVLWNCCSLGVAFLFGEIRPLEWKTPRRCWKAFAKYQKVCQV